MTIQCEWYLNCDTCHAIYPIKSDDAQGTEDEALDDGWAINEDKENAELNVHICKRCISKLINKGE